MACSCCGADTTLVYSGILEGNLCMQCYDKYIGSGAVDKVKAAQKGVFEYLDKVGLTKAFTKELIRVHNNFLVNPIPEPFGVWKNRQNFTAMFNLKYRGHDAVLSLSNRSDAGTNYLQECITYVRKDKTPMQVINKIYADGRVVKGKTIELPVENKDKTKKYIKVVDSADEVYIIDSQTGNVIEGYVRAGVGFEYRTYGNSENWRFAGPADSRYGKAAFRSMPDFVKYLDKNSDGCSSRMNLLRYKNGKCKYVICDIDHGSRRMHGSNNGGIKNAYFTDEKLKTVKRRGE